MCEARVYLVIKQQAVCPLGRSSALPGWPEGAVSRAGRSPMRARATQPSSLRGVNELKSCSFSSLQEPRSRQLSSLQKARRRSLMEQVGPHGCRWVLVRAGSVLGSPARLGDGPWELGSCR